MYNHTDSKPPTSSVLLFIKTVICKFIDYSEGDIYDGIVAAIKTYDEIQDVEDVKTAANAESNDSGAYVVFRPNDSSGEFKVYNSKEEMLEKLSKKFQIDLRIDDTREFNNKEFGWKYEQFVTFRDRTGMTFVFGYCDCKTFKRG